MLGYGGERVIRSFLRIPGAQTPHDCIALLRYIIQDEIRQERQTLYIAECLRVISENTAGNHGVYIKMSLFDVLNPKEETSQTAEELVDDFLNKICGKGE